MTKITFESTVKEQNSPVRKCKLCGANVYWIVTTRGRRMLVNAGGDHAYESHFTWKDTPEGKLVDFATYPQAGNWRRK